MLDGIVLFISTTYPQVASTSACGIGTTSYWEVIWDWDCYF
jgi:hypothetical protein